MFILYTLPGCHYCGQVKERLGALAFTYEERNVLEPRYRAELLERGGKGEVPFLVDPERDVSLYESGDIIAYLESLKRPAV